MEFEKLSSTQKAVRDLSIRLGLHKVKSSSGKDRVKTLLSYLLRINSLSEKSIKSLSSLSLGSELVSEYIQSTRRLISISEEIVNRLEVDFNVKKDLKET